MSALAVRIGVAIGMVATVVSFFAMFKLLMGACFFEQGCGQHESLGLMGLAVASCMTGFLTAWGVISLFSTRSWRDPPNS